MESIRKHDPEIYQIIKQEAAREEGSLVLIASENYASQAVMEAQGSVLTNKYAEGYPGARYYGGCEFMDQVEDLANTRLRALFGAKYSNVQPHSGSQANMAVYMACLRPGETILGMSLSHGGHLSHGSAVNFSGRYYKAIGYSVDPSTGLIDYEQIRELVSKYRPSIIVAGASAYPRVIDFMSFRRIADEFGAYFMADIAHIAGLVAAGLHPSPVGVADFITSTTHKTMRGPRGGFILAEPRFGDAINKAIFPGIQGGPLMHVIAAKAVAFKEALSEDFRSYQQQVIKNAKAMAKALMDLGFELVSKGTDNHLMLVDLTRKGITGKEAEESLGRAGIVVNKNTIPFDKKGPQITSGIRIGTPAVTTRGMKESEMERIALWIDEVLRRPGDSEVVNKVKKRVEDLVRAFPIYKGLMA